MDLATKKVSTRKFSKMTKPKLRKQSKKPLPTNQKTMNDIMHKYYGEQMKGVFVTRNEFNFKPVKYYYKPRLVIKIPYLYIDKDWDTGKRGLFLGIHEIEIGKRKIKNENYKKQMAEWKKENNSIYFINESNFKFNLKNEKTI